MNARELVYNPYSLTAVVLVVSLAYKLPAVIRSGRNPLLRQVGGLLLAACGVFIFAAPPTIRVVNDVTGVTNFSAPWVYSLLTGFCASCLLLIIKWRGGPAASIRRAKYWVYGSYGTLVSALWILFALGDHDVERLRDLDTYYANTPYMREMIVLYLLGHTVAVLITSALLWSWEGRVRGTGWLHRGVVLLGVGYAMNLLYDGVKLTPIVARWTGRDDLDWMSTDLAPPIAALVGLLIALGFILPHAGERLSHWWAIRREYRALRPLARVLHSVPAASAPVALGRFAPIELRLTRRQTFIRDALRHVAPFMDAALRERTREHHLAVGGEPAAAEAAADAATITAAVLSLRADDPKAPERPLQQPPESMQALVPVSRALRRDSVRPRRTAASREESVMS
ncbi:MAB_1171c family putative transporter [Streptomyces sp. NPDC048362]|uniref:MAB_1171c family putative transporter n=1 Tax=Streptomyces sp. NPDC048362 TaxID=3365539 RepID=UPI003716C4E6